MQLLLRVTCRVCIIFIETWRLCEWCYALGLTTVFNKPVDLVCGLEVQGLRVAVVDEELNCHG